MKTFPDMTVTFDKLGRGTPDGGRSSCDAVFYWTLTRTNSGPRSIENAFESADMNFGNSTMMDSSGNQKATLTVRSTIVSSSTESTWVGAIDLNRLYCFLFVRLIQPPLQRSSVRSAHKIFADDHCLGSIQTVTACRMRMCF
jgi:hypothetical protein